MGKKKIVQYPFILANELHCPLCGLSIEDGFCGNRHLQSNYLIMVIPRR